MTIDDHGRAHRPAGSPASTGGQFSAQPSPAPACELGQTPRTRGEQLFDAYDRDQRILRLRSAALVTSAVLDAHPEAKSLRLVTAHEEDPDEAYFEDVQLFDADGYVIDPGEPELERIRLLCEASDLPRTNDHRAFSAYDDSAEADNDRQWVVLPLDADRHDNVADELQHFDSSQHRSHDERHARWRKQREVADARRLAFRHEDAAALVDAAVALHPDARQVVVGAYFQNDLGYSPDGFVVIDSDGTEHAYGTETAADTPEDALHEAIRNLGTAKHELTKDGIASDVEEHPEHLATSDIALAYDITDRADGHRALAAQHETIADRLAKEARA